MKLPNPIKLIGKLTALVATVALTLLVEQLLSAEIKEAIDQFLRIPFGVYLLVLELVVAGFIIRWIFRSDSLELPIFFGGWRLRRLVPLVDMLSLAKEHALSDEDAYGVTHAATAVELTEKLNKLGIQCPDLTARHRPLFPGRQMDMAKESLAFLKRLRFYCLDRDLKGGQEYGEKTVAWLNRTPSA